MVSARQVEHLIRRSARSLGGEVQATLHRGVDVDGDEFSPTSISYSSWTVDCLAIDIDLMEGLHLVRGQTRRILISGDGAMPLPGDKISIGGAQFNVRSVRVLKPAGTALGYELEVSNGS